MEIFIIGGAFPAEGKWLQSQTKSSDNEAVTPLKALAF